MPFGGVEVPIIGPDIINRTWKLFYEWVDGEWMNEWNIEKKRVNIRNFLLGIN